MWNTFREKIRCEGVASMDRDRDLLEDILPESSTQLVSLNTRIPRNVSRMIDECVGILQTKSNYHKVSKQEAVQVILEKGIQAIREDFLREDLFDLEEVESKIEKTDNSLKTVEEVERFERTVTTQKTYDMKAYAEFANKSFYTPPQQRTTKADSETARKLQTKLGLR